MNGQEHDILIMYLKRIEKQNDDQLALLHAHIKDDGKVKETVQRHSMYFSALGLGLPALGAAIAKKLGWKD